MSFTLKSRLVLVLLSLVLLTPFVFDDAHAQYEDLSSEQIDALKRAWHVTSSGQSGTGWTDIGFDDSAWSTASLAVFEDGLSTAKSEVYAWPGAEAEWIWSTGGTTVYFRRNFGLPRALVNDDDYEERVVVRLTANNDYSFYINGELVSQDGSEDDDDWKTYEQIDVTDYLQVGDNVFAVQATNTDDPENYGLLFDAELITMGAGGVIAPPPERQGGC